MIILEQFSSLENELNEETPFTNFYFDVHIQSNLQYIDINTRKWILSDLLCSYSDIEKKAYIWAMAVMLDSIYGVLNNVI